MRKQAKEFIPLVLGTFGIGFVFYRLTTPRLEPSGSTAAMSRREVLILYATTLATTTELYNEKLIELKRKLGAERVGCGKPTEDGWRWRAPYVPKGLRTARWDDERLVEHIRRCWVLPPDSRPTTPAADASTNAGPRRAANRTRAVDEILRRRTGGFYVECGAGAGQPPSPDSPMLDGRRNNWTGLLIEPETSSFERLMRSERRRDSFLSNVCLAPSDRAVELDFARVVDEPSRSGLLDYGQFGGGEATASTNVRTVQCFPLASVLRAINASHVDYLSLDVEGAEFEILKSLPYDDVGFDLISVDYGVRGAGNATEAKLRQIRNFLVKEKGYREVAKTPDFHVVLVKR